MLKTLHKFMRHSLYKMKTPQLEQTIEKKSKFTIKEIKLWMNIQLK